MTTAVAYAVDSSETLAQGDCSPCNLSNAEPANKGASIKERRFLNIKDFASTLTSGATHRHGASSAKNMNCNEPHDTQESNAQKAYIPAYCTYHKR